MHKHVLVGIVLILVIAGTGSYSALAFMPMIPSPSITQTTSVQQYDHIKNCATDQHTPTNFKTYLTHFACGHVQVLSNGTTVRHFTLLVNDYHGNGAPIAISTQTPGLMKPFQEGPYQPVIFHAWMFNGSVPGPTIRVTEGDHVFINVINSNDSAFPHSWHTHSIHGGAVDGVSGYAGMIEPGQHFIYSFVAAPAGLYPYHCHMAPIEEHVSRGLYGLMIIDPHTPRSPAHEMVMMLNSYTFSYEGLNGSGHFTPTLPATYQQMKQNLSAVEFNSDEGNGPDNQFYSVNGMPFGYIGTDSINLQTHTPYRIYLANMVEFDPINNFHIHGTMMYYWPAGTTESSKIYTDIVGLMQGDRGIAEFTYNYPGIFLFHSHLNHFSDLGWLGTFHVSNSGILEPYAGYFLNNNLH